MDRGVLFLLPSIHQGFPVVEVVDEVHLLSFYPYLVRRSYSVLLYFSFVEVILPYRVFVVRSEDEFR